MPIKSNNTKGNPYHDEKTGEFTSEGANSARNEELETEETQLNEQEVFRNEKPVKKAKLKEGADIEELKKKVAERKQVFNLPYFTSANDITNYVEKFFPERLIREIEEVYDFSGNNFTPYNHAFFKFSDGRDGLQSNIFVQLLSKYRYAQMYCDTIERSEFDNIRRMISSEGSGKFSQYYDGHYSYPDTNLDRLARNPDLGCGYVIGYRGIHFGSYSPNPRQDLEEVLNSYIGYHSTQPTYGAQGCYGTVNYVAMSKRYADAYAGYNSYGGAGHTIKHIINVKDARIMYEPQVERIQRDLISNANNIQTKLAQHFSQYMDSYKAQQLATGFVGSIRHDFGTTCVLMGGDVLVAGIGNGNQMDILNWKVARILKDW